MSTAVLLEPAAPALPSVDLLLREVRATGVRVPNPAAVRDYLTRYPELNLLTRKVSEQTAAEFDGQAELSLELYEDRETDDTTLTLYIRQPDYDAQAWAAIERLRESYEDELADSLGFLHVTLDFRANANR